MKRFYTYLLVLGLMFSSCKKDWLDQKRDSALLVPTSLRDMRFLLNNNFPYGVNYTGAAELAADDYTIADNYYNGLIAQERLGYIWNDQTFAGITFVAEWDYAYQTVLQANVILDGLKKITTDNTSQAEYNDVKGGALFMRARAFFTLAQLFAPAYDAQTATNDPGIPLRLNSDINEKSVRASVQQTYEQITGDLKTAAGLLKAVAAYKTDASRPAAYALLSRCYLSMRVYDEAFNYADLSLKDYSKLIDYNALKATATYPVTAYSDEVIFDAPINSYASFRKPNGAIDATLYASYDSNDLRKSLFFVLNPNGTYSFRGSYEGSNQLFGGVATDEQYLTRAECFARKGAAASAMADLNTLLKARYKAGTFVPLTASNATAALSVVLLERRKELLMRAIRWTDLRRLNKETAFQQTIKKTVNGQIYSLPPNDAHYTFLIPSYVINASGIQQNPR